MTTAPLTKLQKQVLATIADAKAGEISGLSIASWLLRRQHPDGIRSVLLSLQSRGLITMRPTDGPTDEFRRRFPDRLKAMYAIKRNDA